MSKGDFVYDKNYAVNLIEGGAFGGLKADKAENTQDFTGKTKSWFGIINTDLTATLVISDNFNEPATLENFNLLCGESGRFSTI